MAGIGRWVRGSKGPDSDTEAVGTDDPPPLEDPMLDLVMLALGLAFFALTVGYAFACERL